MATVEVGIRVAGNGGDGGGSGGDGGDGGNGGKAMAVVAMAAMAMAAMAVAAAGSVREAILRETKHKVKDTGAGGSAASVGRVSGGRMQMYLWPQAQPFWLCGAK